MPTVTRVLPWRRGPNRSTSLEIAGLLAAYHQHHPKGDTSLIERAFTLAASAHEGQFRKSGEPYIRHPVAVATIVARQGIDDITIAGALLHDAVEDTAVGLQQLEDEFGPDLARIVDGVTKLERVKYDSKELQQAATMRKMIVAIASDMRVLIIKLADRLHNLSTIAALPAFKQERSARETLDVYAPLAHRLGMQEMKWQLEDLSFAALHPRRYAEIDQMIQQRAPEREIYLAQVLGDVQARLAELGIVAQIDGRPKHLWSIYEKMVVKGRGFDEIFDLVGIRVIVDSVRECYGALGSIHATWRPVQGRFKDYIAMPKFNLYQSLHTTVVGPQARPIEIQIRTREMHNTAEFGVAAHWMYKTDGRGGQGTQGEGSTELGWLDAIVEWQSDVDEPGDYLESLRLDLYQDQVFVFTPRGDARALSAGATPIDFAYAVHTEVGHRCIGARVNGRLVPLDHQLTNGDTVEVLTSKAEDAGPSRDWLQIATSPRARSKIRGHFNKERREDDEERGRDLLSRALRRSGISLSRAATSGDLDDATKHFNQSDLTGLLRAVGGNHLDAKQVAHFLVQSVAESDDEPEVTPAQQTSSAISIASKGTDRVEVDGDSGMMVKLARCCTPVPGDPIVGYVTRGRGVSVHHQSCSNVADLEQQPERLIPVDWTGVSGSTFMVTVQIEALDRKHLLRDITAVLGDLHINILSAQVTTRRDRVGVLRFSFELADPTHLEHALQQVRSVGGVYDAYRVVPGMG